MPSYRIMIVEDDEIISGQIAEQLEQWGYETARVKDFRNVAAQAAAMEPALILLDIMLPFYNGFHWCTKIREISKVPIIFLSSASDNMNIVMAMNMGADHFISKPFDMTVLIAKIQALLRRTYAFREQSNLLECREAVLNLSEACLIVGSERVELTKNEFRILEVLMRQPDTVVSREDLMQHLWESDAFVDDNTLTVNVTRLRRKLEEAGLPDYIKTRKGIGYVINAADGNAE